MIRTVAELLEAFRLREVEILDNQNLKHAPTIGRMYEGLTQEILRKALPGDSDLRVVSGFIENEEGELSRQMDCMLVSGEGMRIPYTEDYKYQLAQVIVVLEVKKNLYSNTLDSAYHNLLSAKKLSLKGFKDNEMSRRQFGDAFYSLVGEDPFSYKNFNEISVWKKQIGLALNAESLIPIRIVIGYHGFASENSLREAFITYLTEKLGHDGYGPVSFPNLIISGDFSLIKLNCMPYGIRLSDRESLYKLFGLVNLDASESPISGDNLWPLYGSYPENPLLLLIELIWTRLEYNQQLNIISNDLGLEIIRPLVLAKAIQRDNLVGWHYEFVPISDEHLAKLPKLLNWKPIEVSDEQCIIILTLIDNESSGLEGLDLQDLEFLNFNKDHLDFLIKSITEMGIAVLDDTRLKLLTRQLGVVALPNGRIMVGDNNEGMFTKWLSSQNFS